MPTLPNGFTHESLLADRWMAGFAKNVLGNLTDGSADGSADDALTWDTYVITDADPNATGAGTLRDALSVEQRWIVFDVDIDAGFTSVISKSAHNRWVLDGRGHTINFRIDATTCFYLERCTNWAMVNIRFDLQVGASGGADGITNEAPGTAWFHHVEGDGIGPDDLGSTGDGMIDTGGVVDNSVSYRPDRVGFSYCKFTNHGKLCLAVWETVNGETPLPSTDADRPKYTAYKVLFRNNMQRQFLFRSCLADLINCWWDGWGNTAGTSGQALESQEEAYVRPRNCIWTVGANGRSNASRTTGSQTADGWLRNGGGNLLEGGANLNTRDTTPFFDPSTYYTITPDTADAALKADLEANAGATLMQAPGGTTHQRAISDALGLTDVVSAATDVAGPAPVPPSAITLPYPPERATRPVEVRLFVGPVLAYTDRPVQVPFFSASFTEGISRDIGWTVVLDAQTVRDMGLDLRAWRAAVYLQVDSWLTGGFVTQRAWDRGEDTAGKVTMRGGGWMSYLDRRHYTRNVTYTAAEQFDIVADVVSWLQTTLVASPDGLGDVGLELVREPETTGRLRDRQYFDHDVKGARDLIEELAQVDDGFDWAPATSWPAGQNHPSRLLRLGYPVIGANPQHRPVLTDGSTCVIVGEDHEGEAIATRVHATGQAADGDVEHRPVATNTAADTDGLPMLETTVSHDTTANPATLAKHAARAVAAGFAYRSVRVDVLDIRVHTPELTRPGDRVTLVGDQPGLSEAVGAVQPWRIISRTINANQDGVISQTLEVAREDRVAVPGPHAVRRHDVRMFKRAKRQKEQERLRQKAGRLKGT